MKKIKINWKKYAFEFLIFFLGITLAFALDNWNDDRNERESEKKILTEIRNGLELDLSDVKSNVQGHIGGIKACKYFRRLINNEKVGKDSLDRAYAILLRNFISIQNKSGYESLKSNGLKLVQNDSLRFEIITLYDNYYEVLEKLEENYAEMQFNKNYFEPINNLLAEYMIFDNNGKLTDIASPIKLSKVEKNRFLSYLMSIEKNREFVLQQYYEVEENIGELVKSIDSELGN